MQKNLRSRMKDHCDAQASDEDVPSKLSRESVASTALKHFCGALLERCSPLMQPSMPVVMKPSLQMGR